MDDLTDTVNLALSRTELFNNQGGKMHLLVAGGKFTRLLWKSGITLLQALADAHSSAGTAALMLERERQNCWPKAQAAPYQGVH